MPFELRMYIILATMWIVSRMAASGNMQMKTFQTLVMASVFMAGAYHVFGEIHSIDAGGNFIRLYYFFFSGAACYILREHIRLSRPAFLLVSCLLAISLIDKVVFSVIYCLTFAYVLLYLAYIPAGSVRKYNQMGDYSYGVYIYAFPVQQAVAASIPGIGVLGMLAISAVATLFLATISWHFLEFHALKLRRTQAHG